MSEANPIETIKVWFEISGGSGNRGFEKSGFHCICEAWLIGCVYEKQGIWPSSAPSQLPSVSCKSDMIVQPCAQQTFLWVSKTAPLTVPTCDPDHHELASGEILGSATEPRDLLREQS